MFPPNENAGNILFVMSNPFAVEQQIRRAKEFNSFGFAVYLITKFIALTRIFRASLKFYSNPTKTGSGINEIANFAFTFA